MTLIISIITDLLTAVVALTPSTALLRFVMMRALAVLGVDIGRWGSWQGGVTTTKKIFDQSSNNN